MKRLTRPETDLTEQEQNQVDEFINQGCPDVASVDDSHIHYWYELYLYGKNYGEIAKIVKTSKTLVLYHAQKLNWYGKKLSHYKDLFAEINQKVSNVKLDSVKVMTDLLTRYNREFTNKLNNFFASNITNDKNKIDMKDLISYLKIVDTLDKRIGDGLRKANEKGPLVNVNVENASKITQVDNKTITIETEEVASQVLKALADAKRKTTT
jgi:hypothetical protein